jgi:hypothetical protein
MCLLGCLEDLHHVLRINYVGKGNEEENFEALGVPQEESTWRSLRLRFKESARVVPHYVPSWETKPNAAWFFRPFKSVSPQIWQLSFSTTPSQINDMYPKSSKDPVVTIARVQANTLQSKVTDLLKQIRMLPPLKVCTGYYILTYGQDVFRLNNIIK